HHAAFDRLHQLRDVAVAGVEIAERVGDADDRPLERVVGIALGLDERLAQEQRERLVAVAREALAQPFAHRLLLCLALVLPWPPIHDRAGGRKRMPTPYDLTGQVAIITGSSKGIGRSIAETMAALGAKVVDSSSKKEPCEEVAAGIRKKGGEAIVIPCNISRRPEVEALVSETLKAFGKIDILVCNAAVNPVFGPLGQLTDEAFDKIMGANVKSNLWLCNLVIPGMAERGGGAVV